MSFTSGPAVGALVVEIFGVQLNSKRNIVLCRVGSKAQRFLGNWDHLHPAA
jgi:hypothetical protein